MMLLHLKYSIPDFILCLPAGLGLGINVAQSFLLPAGLSADVPRTALVTAVVIFVMILLSYSRITAVIGGIAGGVLFVLLIALTVLGIFPGFAESEDAEANVGLWYLVVVLCAVAVYLLSRTMAGSWILIGFGAVLLAYFLLLEYVYYVWGLLLLLGAMGAWLCYLTYRKKMLSASAARTAFLPVLGHAAGIAAACLAVGFLLWWGIIRPLAPPTQDLVLSYNVLQGDYMEVLNLYDPGAAYDPELASDNVQSEEETNELEEDTESEEDEDVAGEQNVEHSESEQTDEELDSRQEEGTAQYITYDRWISLAQVVMSILLPILAAALIALFFLRRKIWYKRKVQGLGDGAYIRFFYPWYLRRIRRLGLPAPRGNTPLEYAAQLGASTRFLDDTGVTWEEVSRIYAHAAYSGREPEPGEREKFERFYRGFYRCCRKKLRLSWLWKSLRL